MNKNMRDISFLYNEEPDLDKAWEDLRQKLDEKLPVKKNSRSKSSFVFPYKAAALSLILIACSLLTNNYYYNNKQLTTIYVNDLRSKAASLHKNGEPVFGKSDIISQKNNPEKNIPENTENTKARSSAGLNNKTESVQLPFRLLHNKLNTPYGNDSHLDNAEKIVRYSAIRDINHLPITRMVGPGKLPSFYKNTVPPGDKTSIDPSSVKKDKRHKKENSVIGFDIGAYYNIGSSLSGIYPIANVNVLITNKSAISLGIGLSSNVSIRNFAPKEAIILNDTANHVRFGVTSNKVTKVTYIDLPVSFKYWISERWAVNAGAQVSFLQNLSKEPAEYKAYDFQADISKVISPNYITGINGSGLNPLRTYREKYTVKKANWRFIAGISYQLKGAGLKFQYQRSFTANYNLFDFGGIHSTKKLSIFTVGVYYRVR